MTAFLLTNSNSKTFLLRLYPLLVGDDRLIILNTLISAIPNLSKSSVQMNLGKLIIEKISSTSEQEYISQKILSVLPLMLSTSTCYGFLDSVISKIKPPFVQPLYIEIMRNIDCMFEKKVAYYFYKKLLLGIKEEEIISFTIETIISLLDSMPFTQYGSLIIQTVLKTFELSLTTKLLAAFKNKIIKFAVSKHSPRIIEAALDQGQEVFFDLFYIHIVKQSKIKFLLNTANGYYIIEKALQKCPNLIYLQDIKLQIYNHKNDISSSLKSKFDKLLMISYKSNPQTQLDNQKLKANSFNSNLKHNYNNDVSNASYPYAQTPSKIKGQIIMDHSNTTLKQSPGSFNYYNNMPPYYVNQPQQYFPRNDLSFPQQQIYYVPSPMYTSSNVYNNNYVNAEIQSNSVNSPCLEFNPHLKKSNK